MRERARARQPRRAVRRAAGRPAADRQRREPSARAACRGCHAGAGARFDRAAPAGSTAACASAGCARRQLAAGRTAASRGRSAGGETSPTRCRRIDRAGCAWSEAARAVARAPSSAPQSRRSAARRSGTGGPAKRARRAADGVVLWLDRGGRGPAVGAAGQSARCGRGRPGARADASALGRGRRRRRRVAAFVREP